MSQRLSKAARAGRFVPHLEVLEDRCVLQAIGLSPADGGLAGTGGSTSISGSLQPTPTTLNSANPSANWSLGPPNLSANLATDLSLMTAAGNLESLTGSGVVLFSGAFQLTGSALANSGFDTTGLFSEDETVSLPTARMISETGSLLSLNPNLNNPNELSNGIQLLLQTPIITLPELPVQPNIPPTIPLAPPVGTGGTGNSTSGSSSHPRTLPTAGDPVSPNTVTDSSSMTEILAIETPAGAIPPAAADAVLASNSGNWRTWDDEEWFSSSLPSADGRGRDIA